MIDSYGISDTGCVRHNNEDRILVDHSLSLFIVADGMGGHTHGEMAAELAIASMQHYIESSRDQLDVTWPFGYNFELSINANLLITAMQIANRQVWRQAEQAPEYAGMGTTLAAAFVSDVNKMTVGNVGDSRVYLWRRGTLQQLSVDDTWVRAISGRGTEQVDIANHPLRNFLTQAAGSKDLVDVHTSELDLETGDVILLSSDGMHGVVPDAAIAATIASGDSPAAIAARLVELAKTGGSADNISVVLLVNRP
jgi:serine/threonine protein phosphatase PrpC